MVYDKESIGTALKLIRTAIADITLVDAHRKTGIAANTIHRTERGERDVSVQQLILLCNSYGVTLDFFNKVVAEVQSSDISAKLSAIRNAEEQYRASEILLKKKVKALK